MENVLTFRIQMSINEHSIYSLPKIIKCSAGIFDRENETFGDTSRV